MFRQSNAMPLSHNMLEEPIGFFAPSIIRHLINELKPMIFLKTNGQY
jgi:hypothetical protein